MSQKLRAVPKSQTFMSQNITWTHYWLLFIPNPDYFHFRKEIDTKKSEIAIIYDAKFKEKIELATLYVSQNPFFLDLWFANIYEAFFYTSINLLEEVLICLNLLCMQLIYTCMEIVWGKICLNPILTPFC